MPEKGINGVLFPIFDLERRDLGKKAFTLSLCGRLKKKSNRLLLNEGVRMTN